MTAMKAYASRGFNAHALDSPGRRRCGSTRYLWQHALSMDVRAAIQDVVREQGESMVVFEMPRPSLTLGVQKRSADDLS